MKGKLRILIDVYKETSRLREWIKPKWDIYLQVYFLSIQEQFPKGLLKIENR